MVRKTQPSCETVSSFTRPRSSSINRLAPYKVLPEFAVPSSLRLKSQTRLDIAHNNRLTKDVPDTWYTKIVPAPSKTGAPKTTMASTNPGFTFEDTIKNSQCKLEANLGHAYMQGPFSKKQIKSFQNFIDGKKAFEEKLGLERQLNEDLVVMRANVHTFNEIETAKKL